MNRMTFFILALLGSLPFSAVGEVVPLQVRVSIDASHVVRVIEPRLLGGTNVAGWTSADKYASPSLRALTGEMWPGVIRLPGGSWGDVVFWNGNGMRGADGDVDPTRTKDGYPAIDYSDYAPSIVVDQNGHPHKGWQENSDVKTMHEFIHALPGCDQMAIVNCGTGRPIDAAEWVKWANQKMGYHVKYWEVGNELDGSWEAGHFLANGKELTADMYAQRYKAIARAMKAVDPTIKIGGSAASLGFTEAMLRDAGEYVDFVSVHMYPGNPAEPAETQFSAVREASDAAQRVHQLIAKYQPKRAGQIKLAITEWSPPERYSGVEIANGLWAGVFIREAVLSGIDILTKFEWEGLSEPAVQPAKGAAPDANGVWRPRATYWALWLWNHYSGDKLLAALQEGSVSVRAVATRSDDAVYIMLINGDASRPADATINLNGFEPAAQGETATLSTETYFWNYLTQRVEWSLPPKISLVDTGVSFDVRVPAFSIVSVRVPSASHPELSSLAQNAQPNVAGRADNFRLRMILPSEAYPGDQVEGWVEAVDADSEAPCAGITEAAHIVVNGKGWLEPKEVGLAGAAGRFVLRAVAPGVVTVTATVETASASSTVTFKPAVPRPHIFWGFDEFRMNDFHSDCVLKGDTSVRPNNCVARVDFPESPAKQGGVLLRIDGLPGSDRLDLGNTRGVTFDLKTSADFSCGDPNARVDVVMQSRANWWMVLGSVPLAGNKDWTTHRLVTVNGDYIKAMPFAGSLVFLFGAGQQVHGSVYLDNVGFMVR
jgi:hypothetical protein